MSNIPAVHHTLTEPTTKLRYADSRLQQLFRLQQYDVDGALIASVEEWRDVGIDSGKSGPARNHPFNLLVIFIPAIHARTLAGDRTNTTPVPRRQREGGGEPSRGISQLWERRNGNSW